MDFGSHARIWQLYRRVGVTRVTRKPEEIKSTWPIYYQFRLGVVSNGNRLLRACWMREEKRAKGVGVVYT